MKGLRLGQNVSNRDAIAALAPSGVNNIPRATTKRQIIILIVSEEYPFLLHKPVYLAPVFLPSAKRDSSITCAS